MIYNGQKRESKLRKFWNTVQPQRIQFFDCYFSIQRATNFSVIAVFSPSSTSSVVPTNLSMWEIKCRLHKCFCCYCWVQLTLDNCWHCAHFSTTTYSNGRGSIDTGTQVGELMKMCSLGWAGCSSSAHEPVDISSVTRGRKSRITTKECSKFFLYLLFVV